jgi:hypothetical protein
MSEHPADRFARFIRPLMVALVPVLTFVGAGSYAAMGVLAMKTWPWWVSAPAIAVQMLAILGLASLIDSLRERLPQTEDEQA